MIRTMDKLSEQIKARLLYLRELKSLGAKGQVESDVEFYANLLEFFNELEAKEKMHVVSARENPAQLELFEAADYKPQAPVGIDGSSEQGRQCGKRPARRKKQVIPRPRLSGIKLNK